MMIPKKSQKEQSTHPFQNNPIVRFDTDVTHVSSKKWKFRDPFQPFPKLSFHLH
jgi:hypothetical protein